MMKKLLSLLLAAALCLALAGPAMAADPKGDAMRAYADIVAKAQTYDYGYSDFDLANQTWQYAVVTLADAPDVPTLLLQTSVESYYIGYMDSTRLFRYDPATGAVVAPETTLASGTAAVGGFRGGLGICNGLLSTHQFAAMSGEGDITTYALAGGTLKGTVVWTGRIDQTPDDLAFTTIDWKDVGDTAAFDAYKTTTAPAGPKVVRSPQNLTVDGVAVDCEKYNIDGSNYFKLRDLACLLTETPVCFAVEWDPVAGAVIIARGFPYEPVGGELVIGEDKSATAQPSAQTVWYLDAQVTDLSVYNIGGNNYFKLRDLGNLLGFEVDYDAATNTAIVLTGAPVQTPDAVDPQAAAFDALWAWVAANANEEYNSFPSYVESAIGEDGSTCDYALVNEQDEDGQFLRLMTVYYFPDGKVDSSWLYLDRSESEFFAAYFFFLSVEDADPFFSGGLYVDPGAFSGSEPAAFDYCESGTLEEGGYELLCRYAADGISSSLHWLDDLLHDTPEFSGSACVSDFGFTPAALDTEGLYD